MHHCLIVILVFSVGCSARSPLAPAGDNKWPFPELFHIVGIHQGGPADPGFPEGGGYGPLLPRDPNGGYTLRLNNDYTLELIFSAVPEGYCLAYTVSYTWLGNRSPENYCSGRFPQVFVSWDGFNTQATDNKRGRGLLKVHAAAS
jgi:hypothetical protein